VARLSCDSVWGFQTKALPSLVVLGLLFSLGACGGKQDLNFV
jgi:hypothetical protein